MFFRADSLKKINGFDESYLRHQDVETLVRFFKDDRNKMLAIDEILVVKIGDDSMNPNIDKAIIYKEKFLNDFKKDIELSENREYIYWKNYSDLLKIAIQNKKYNKIKIIRNSMNKYCKYLFKNSINNVIYFVNNYISLKKIKHYIYDFKIKRKLDGDLINQIKKIENIKMFGGTSE